MERGDDTPPLANAEVGPGPEFSVDPRTNVGWDAAKGQSAAAINQMQSFIGQLNGTVPDGTLTPAQAEPFMDQAESPIAMWCGML